ncbi:hypothetical protein [Granulicella sp. dw_53]|uniref:hypothetical protein n=1 Tax=Granulicella sp. dw_53 TaxID=2719792 RepID=UPI001BD3D63B|nr:hypothetical protein [Granulicella sp. dw_53]
MFNQTVQQFFTNYALIQESGFEVFAREQSKLFTPDLVTISRDYRGTLTYHGIDAYFDSLKDWFQYFTTGSNFYLEFEEATSTHALVRMHGNVQLVQPVDGKTVSEEGHHDWTEEFELVDGLIKKLDVKLTLL